MEFVIVRTIPYEAPPEDLRPFFNRKYKACFRNFRTETPGILQRRFYIDEVEKVVSQIPKEQQAEIHRKLVEHWDYVVFCGKERLTEEEFVSEWLDNRVFTTPEQRKFHLEESKKQTTFWFSMFDEKKQGEISWEDWRKLEELIPDLAKKEVFETIDANKDGNIQLEEWCYAILYFHYCSGPESPLSLMFGPIPEK